MIVISFVHHTRLHRYCKEEKKENETDTLVRELAVKSAYETDVHKWLGVTWRRGH